MSMRVCVSVCVNVCATSSCCKAFTRSSLFLALVVSCVTEMLQRCYSSATEVLIVGLIHLLALPATGLQGPLQASHRLTHGADLCVCVCVCVCGGEVLPHGPYLPHFRSSVTVCVCVCV
jgi:hypothetical protein